MSEFESALHCQKLNLCYEITFRFCETSVDVNLIESCFKYYKNTIKHNWVIVNTSIFRQRILLFVGTVVLLSKFDKNHKIKTKLYDLASHFMIQFYNTGDSQSKLAFKVKK